MKILGTTLAIIFSLISFQLQADSLTVSPGGRAIYTGLNRGFSPWYELGIDLSLAKDKKYKVNTSVAGYDRFDTRGMSLAVDSYFFLSETWYINTIISAGWASYLPDYTAGLNLYKVVKSIELNVGSRRMAFDPAINIYTAGIGYYFGNYWLAYSLNMASQVGIERMANTHILTMRKYFRNALQYLEVKGSVGKEIGALVNAEQVSIIPQKLLGMAYFHNVKARSLGIALNTMVETIRPDTDRLRMSLSIILK
jgi:YaiO family outer membrane protein